MESPPPRLSNGCSDAYLDTRTFLLYVQQPLADDDFRTLAFWDSRQHHEVGHWRRMLGSTLGHLMLLQRFARDKTLLRAFDDLDEYHMPRVREHRAAGRPIWSVVPFVNPDLGGTSFGLSGQFWGELYLAGESLLDGMAGWPSEQMRDEVMSFSVADSWLYAATGLSTDYIPYPQDHKLARGWLRGPCQDEVTSCGVLTTRLLLECASTLDEALLIGKDRSPEWDEVRAFARHKLASTEYGTPAVIAKNLVRQSVNDMTVLALIDWALNPPLPMLSATYEPADWREFYPPARFVDAAVALRGRYRDVGVFEASEEEFARLRAHLLESGLRYGHVDVQMYPDRRIRFPTVDEGIAAFYVPILQASAALLAFRDSQPEWVAVPATGMAVEIAIADVEEAAELTERLVAKLVPLYPFVSLHPGTIEPGPGVSMYEAFSFMTGAMTLVALDAVVNETSGLSDEYLSRSCDASEVLRLAAHVVGKRTGFWLVPEVAH